MKVFCTRVMAEAGMKLLSDAGVEVLTWKKKEGLTQTELITNCRHCDALLSVGVNKIDAFFLRSVPHLKVISLHSAGYDNVDIREATRLGIPVGNTPGVVTNATAEAAFLLMLSASRKAMYMHKRIEKAQWSFFDPTVNLGISLRGKTIGIFGLGTIGFEMARLCREALGMKVIYHNRNRNQSAEEKLGATWVPFETLLSDSDVISVHSVLSNETLNKFNIDVFRKMRSDAIFVNTARGKIHDENDLIAALNEGLIWGAGLDVTNPEPMQPDNPLLKMPNVAVTPHIGGATVDARNRQSSAAAKNIIAGLKGERIPFPVNPEVYND